MDDPHDESSTGISGWAGYLLGRMAESSSRDTDELIQRWHDRRRPPARTYDANEVHEVIDGWKKAVRFHEDRIEKIKAGRAAVRLERDELRERCRRLEEEAGAQLIVMRDLADLAEAQMRSLERAYLRESDDDEKMLFQRVEIIELKEEIEKLKGGRQG